MELWMIMYLFFKFKLNRKEKNKFCELSISYQSCLSRNIDVWILYDDDNNGNW